MYLKVHFICVTSSEEFLINSKYQIIWSFYNIWNSGMCKSDNEGASLTYRSKKFNCMQLVKHNPSLCYNKNIKEQCCKSCGSIVVKPLKVQQLI